jgi:hypothetical protein
LTFSQPSAGGDKFEPKDHFGKLLLIYPKAFNPAEQTSNGVTPAADVDIIVVDSPGPDGRPLFISDARLFGNLAKSVRNDVGSQVLGRLGQGPNTRGTPPWILSNFTDADAALAGPVHQAYQAGQFKPAENPMAPPAAAPPATGYAPAQQYQAPPPPQGATYVPGVPEQVQYQAQQQFPQGPAQAAPQQAPQPPFGGQAPAPPAGGVDPQLAAFLASRGVQVTPDMTQQQAQAIAAAFPQ